MKLISPLLFSLAIFCGPLAESSYAGVNLIYGFYSTSFTDIGGAPDIVRKHRSDVDVSGMFGRGWEFNLEGRQITLASPNRGTLELDRNPQGQLIRIGKNGSEVYQISYNQAGFVSVIVSSTGKKSTYRYQGNLLVENVDAENNKYTYSYNEGGKLVRILYPDGRTYSVSYQADRKTVASVVRKGGTKLRYQFKLTPGGKNAPFPSWGGRSLIETRTTVVSSTKGSRVNANQTYFWQFHRANGGGRLKSYYKYTKNSFSEEYFYMPSGLLSRWKSSNGISREYKYDKIHKKVRVVFTTYPNSRKPRLTTVYAYNSDGDPTYANNTLDEKVVMKYSSTGLLVSMEATGFKDHKNEPMKDCQLTFDHDSQGRMKSTSVPGSGSLYYQYDKNSEISKIGANPKKGGHERRVLITQCISKMSLLMVEAGQKSRSR